MRYYLFIFILLITIGMLLLVSLVGMTALKNVTKALLVNSNKIFYFGAKHNIFGSIKSTVISA